MPTEKPKGFSLDQIEKSIAEEAAVEFEPMMPDGEPSGIVLLVKGDTAPSVQAGLTKLMNEHRRKQQVQAQKASRARPGEVFTKFEEDIEFSRKAAAIRLAGWPQGITDEFSEANAIRLLKAAPGFIPQIIEKAGEITGFTSASSTT